MRAQIVIGAAAVAALIVAIGYFMDWGRPWSDQFPHEKRYLLVPGLVTGSREAGVRADFTLTEEKLVDPGEQGQGPILIHPGIATNREGGACLTLSADDLGLTTPATANCQNDGQCKFSNDIEYGYCAPDKRCWVKPAIIADKLCRKSRKEQVKWDPEVVNPLPKTGTIDLGPAKLPAGRTVRARVTTCLETVGGTPETGCPQRGANMVDKWGPAKEL
jgi:hypothetical protein